MNLPTINKKRIIELLKEGKRLDGRKPFDYRDIEIETNVSNKAEGSARVRIGKTEVIVGVKIQTQEPYSDHEDEGTMMVGMEYSPVAGERYESGPPKMNAIETSRVVDRGIRESGFIDWKKLCIEKGKVVYSILVDIYCINDEGNVLDACAIGAVVALMISKLPKYDEKEESIIYGELTDKGLPLTENIPLMMTFYKVGERLLSDPNRDEEDAAESRLTLAISQPKKDKIINSMQKGEIAPLTIENLNEIVSEAEKVYDKLFPLLEKRIKELNK
ncbi:MAG: exosome complex protein Rrp42 [Candidatus Woesearchaeota archaeon]